MLTLWHRFLALVLGIVLGYTGIQGISYWWTKYNTPLGLLTQFTKDWADIVGGSSVVLIVIAAILLIVAFSDVK